LLSLKIGLSGAVVTPSQISLKLGTNKAFNSTLYGGLISNTSGYAMIDRRWNVSPTSQPDADKTVGVKYYFTKDEFDDLKDSLLLHGGGSTKSTLSSATDVNLYKATSGSSFADPHTVSGIVVVNGSSADTNVWVHSTHGSVDHIAEFLVSSFSGGGGGGGAGGGSGVASLPVELIDFSAMAIDQQSVQINWVTASEINNSHFVLERSYDGTTFTGIEQILGNGNSQEINRYQYLDNRIKVNTSIVYYRLIQIDFDGKTSNSNIRKVILTKEGIKTVSRILASPNPFTDKVNLIIQLNEGQEANLILRDIAGKVVYKFNFHASTGYQIKGIDLSTLQSGVYILNTRMGTQEQFLRLIKK